MRVEDLINDFCQLITERTNKAYNNNSEFLPLVDYDKNGVIDAVYIYDRTIGTYASFQSVKSPLLVTIWYNDDAYDYVASFHESEAQKDLAFDTGCASKLAEVMKALRLELA